MIALILPLPPIDFPPPLLPFLLPPPLFFSQVSEDMLRLVVEEAQRSVTGIDTGEGRMIKAVLDMQDTEVSELMGVFLSLPLLDYPSQFYEAPPLIYLAFSQPLSSQYSNTNAKQSETLLYSYQQCG